MSEREGEMIDLRKLHEAATPGPWRAVGPGRDSGAFFVPELTDADCTLAAATRNALPFLLDVVEAAREAMEAGYPPREDQDVAIGRLRIKVEALDAYLNADRSLSKT